MALCHPRNARFRTQFAKNERRRPFAAAFFMNAVPYAIKNKTAEVFGGFVFAVF
jgi:hypothetical protein